MCCFLHVTKKIDIYFFKKKIDIYWRVQCRTSPYGDVENITCLHVGMCLLHHVRKCKRRRRTTSLKNYRMWPSSPRGNSAAWHRSGYCSHVVNCLIFCSVHSLNKNIFPLKMNLGLITLSHKIFPRSFTMATSKAKMCDVVVLCTKISIVNLPLVIVNPCRIWLY